MSRLAPVDPETNFVDMESDIHDAADMVDTLNGILMDLFGKAPANGVYRVNKDDGHQLLFLAGLAVDMTRKVEEAYPVAHKNHFAGRAQG